jgi:uncharacterized protein (DUF2267 family)
MPFPPEYRTASEDFERFLAEIKAQALLATHNQAYAMTRAVLHVFRDHLTVQDALDFATLLPPVLRAVFVDDWKPAGDPAPLPDREHLTREVLGVREPHNSAPETAIADVAAVLRRHVDQAAFDRLLARLPNGAAEFWSA